MGQLRDPGRAVELAATVSDQATVGPTDGIVQVELSIDGDRIDDIVACLRAGAWAWTELPYANVVDASGREQRFDAVMRFADELRREAGRVHAAREVHYRAVAKREEKESRARARTQ